MESSLFKISTNFSRGLNAAISHMIDDEEVQVADNFLFDEGGPKVRQGTALNASLPYPVVTLRKVYLQNGSSYFAAFAGGQFYVSNTSGVFSLVSGPVMSGDIFTTVYDDVLYFTNYSVPVQYYDGTKIDVAGLSSPSFVLQISKMDTPDGWLIAGSGIASVDPDTSITHVDIGTAAVKLITQGQATYGIPAQNDLTKFDVNTSSDTNDLISLFTVHDVKGNFSSLILGFANAFPGNDFFGGGGLPGYLNWEDLDWNGFKYVSFAGMDYSGTIAVSQDGNLWSVGFLPSSLLNTVGIRNGYGGLAVMGSSFIYVTRDKAYHSVDAVTWSGINLPVNMVGPDWKIAANLSMVVAVYSENAWYSYDGISWSPSVTGIQTVNLMVAVGWVQDKFIAVAKLNNVLANNVFSTSDGINWNGFTPTDAAGRIQFGRIAAKNGTACIAGIGVQSGFNFATITRDGSDCSTVVASSYFRSGYIGPMAANTSVFVQLCPNTNQASWSNSGIIWTPVSTPITATWNACVFGSGYFFAIAQNAGIVIRSRDGKSWEQTSSILIASQYVDLVQGSAWIGCGNDGWALTHVIPKSVFPALSGQVWASATPFIRVTSINGSAPAVLTVDNLRMVKTPPMLTRTSANISSQIFFGSSVIKINRFLDDPMEQTVKGLQLQGFLLSGNIIQDGTTFYKATFIKVGPNNIPIESNPCYQTSGTLISNIGAVTVVSLTDIPIAPASWNVVGRRIYRRNASTSAFQYTYMVHNNSGTTFIDRVPMNVLGEVLDETGHWPPPNAKFIYSAADQVTYYFNIAESVGGHKSRVRYSKPYEPYYVPLENVFDIAPGDGTEGTGMFEFQGMLHFLKERSTWILDPNTMTPVQSHASLGCIAPKSLSVGPEHVFWLSDQGIVMYSMRYRLISKEKIRVDPILKALPKEYLKNAVGVYYNNFYLLAVTTDGNTENDTILVYDVINDLWSQFPDINVNCWTTWQGFQDGYRLFYGNNSGFICEFLTGDADISSPIPSKLRTKEFGMPTPGVTADKVFLYVNDLDGQSRDIQVNPYYDWINLSTDADVITTVSGHGVGKARLPGKDEAGFFSIEFVSSGRYQIMHMDIYGKQEGLR